MRKGRDGEKKTGKKREKKEKRRMKIVATTSLPAVDRPNANRWNAARSRQFSVQSSQAGRFQLLDNVSYQGSYCYQIQDREMRVSTRVT